MNNRGFARLVVLGACVLSSFACSRSAENVAGPAATGTGSSTVPSSGTGLAGGTTPTPTSGETGTTSDQTASPAAGVCTTPSRPTTPVSGPCAPDATTTTTVAAVTTLTTVPAVQPTLPAVTEATSPSGGGDAADNPTTTTTAPSAAALATLEGQVFGNPECNTGSHVGCVPKADSGVQVFGPGLGDGGTAVPTDGSGRFSVQLPSGTYTVKGAPFCSGDTQPVYLAPGAKATITQWCTWFGF